MDRVSKRRLVRLQKQEKRDAERYENKKLSAFSAVQDRIPPGLREKLELAFRKGFRVVFERGEGLIEKTYAPEQLKQEYAARSIELSGKMTGRKLRRLNAGGKAAVRGGMGVALAEGTLLGVLGVGLPDIPLFLGGLLRGVYRIALSYGFDYKDEWERCYLLLLIAASLSKGEERTRYAALADAVAQVTNTVTLDACIEAAAGCLAEEMLVAKFVQGLPLVGIVGGLQNVPVYRRITRYAARAYEKRWLQQRKA